MMERRRGKKCGEEWLLRGDRCLDKIILQFYLLARQKGHKFMSHSSITVQNPIHAPSLLIFST